MLTPMAVYVYGAVRLDWGLNELSAAFFIGAIVAGLIGGLGFAQSMAAYLDGMQALLSAAFMVGLARSISLVLTDGRVVDSILNALASPLAHLPGVVSAFLMVPFQALVHIAVPSVSGQAVLTMPLMVPLSDLLGLLAAGAGAGVSGRRRADGTLHAHQRRDHGDSSRRGVPYERWVRFAAVAVAGSVAGRACGNCGGGMVREVARREILNVEF